MAKKKEDQQVINCDAFCDIKSVKDRTRWTLMHLHGKEQHTLEEWNNIFSKLGLD